MLPFFDNSEEIKLSEHQIAWFQKDWDKVKDLTNSYKESSKNLLFMALDSINSKNIAQGEIFENYSKFMIDSLLSHHADSIDQAYYANLFLSGLPDKVHFNYLYMVVPEGKRFSRPAKIEDPLKKKYCLALIGKFYNLNPFKSQSYYDIMIKRDLLDDFLKRAKFLATDSFLKSISKNVKEIKEMKCYD